MSRYVVGYDPVTRAKRWSENEPARARIAGVAGIALSQALTEIRPIVKRDDGMKPDGGTR